MGLVNLNVVYTSGTSERQNKLKREIYEYVLERWLDPAKTTVNDKLQVKDEAATQLHEQRRKTYISTRS